MLKDTSFQQLSSPLQTHSKGRCSRSTDTTGYQKSHRVWNGTRALFRRKSPKKLQIPFSEKELDLVLNQIKYPEGYEGIRDKLIIDLFYTTGIRRAELINLKIQNIDLSNATIKVLGKRNKERIVPILPIIVNEINNYLNERLQLELVNDDKYLL